MKEPKDFEYFMKLPYDVTLKKRDNHYYLIIPELSLIVDGETIEEAYKKLEEEKESYFKKTIETGMTEIIKAPQSTQKERNIFLDLAPFSIKVVIIAIIFSVASYLFIGRITGSVKSINRDFMTSVGMVSKGFKSFIDFPEETFSRVGTIIVRKYSTDLHRIRFLGLITHNPAVHFKASAIKENSGDIQGAIEEMELALGLLSLNSSKNETARKYESRLKELRSKLQ